MSRKLLYTLAALLTAANLSFAQVSSLQKDEIRSLFRENPGLAAGTKAMYPVPDGHHAAAPRGYKVFYISHYGRHGARFETRSGPYDTVFGFLDQAHADGALTEFGEDIYRRFRDLYPYLQNSHGDLTFKGQAQHRGIAERMVRDYPSVFRGKAHVWASASVVPRCILSMMSFLDQMRVMNPKLQLTYSANTADMHYNALVYYDFPNSDDLEKIKRNATYMHEAQETVGKDIQLEPFFLRICKDMEYVNDHGGLVLASSFWSVAGNMQCLDTDVSFRDLFTEDEAYYMWRYSNISYAAMVGRTPASEGILPNTAQSLLQQILDQAEDDINTGSVSVRLRFGHDTVVGPLMSLLGVEGWTGIVANPEDVASRVHSFDIPMASNVQLVFYRNKKNPEDILVRLMYNEKDQVLPLQDQSGAPYYKWQDFRDYYTRVCETARQNLAEAKKNVRQN